MVESTTIIISSFMRAERKTFWLEAPNIKKKVANFCSFFLKSLRYSNSIYVDEARGRIFSFYVDFFWRSSGIPAGWPSRESALETAASDWWIGLSTSSAFRCFFLFFFFTAALDHLPESAALEKSMKSIAKQKKNKMFHNRRVECFSVEGAVSQSRNVE